MTYKYVVENVMFLNFGWQNSIWNYKSFNGFQDPFVNFVWHANLPIFCQAINSAMHDRFKADTHQTRETLTRRDFPVFKSE